MEFMTNLMMDPALTAMPRSVFVEEFLRRGWVALDDIGWDCDATSLGDMKGLGRPLVHFKTHDTEDLVIEGEGFLARANLRYDQIRVWLAAPAMDRAASAGILGKLQELFPITPPPPADEIWLTFWCLGPRGAQRLRRRIAAPTWPEIEANYPSGTRGQLDQVMGPFQPAHGGQLLLWHGMPGTGKTFAIRALGQEWEDWCRLEVVIDPEAFFGEAAYMMQVLMGEGSGEDAPAAEGSGKATVAKAESPRGKWRLLILEDTGELLTADAKTRNGQALSRLLNMVDGLIGQGLRILTLVTTNEPFQGLHPAVGRPGRCAAEVEFVKFDAAEAAEWLRVQGIQDGQPSESTLAELYGKAHEFCGARTRPSIGLAVAGATRG